MATIEIRCKIKLPEPIVLACQQDTSFSPIRWQLANSDTVSIEMDVPEEQIKSQYQMHSSKGNWFVNSKVRAVRLSLIFHGVSNDDVDRLYVKHVAAKTFRAHLETDSGPLDIDYQEALELGRRVVREIVDSANMALRFIRDNFGQHWLRLLTADEETPQNFLDEVRAEWREGTNPWKRLLVAPPVVSIGPAYVGAGNRYLETADWKAMQQAIARNEGPPDGFTLVSDSRERYEQGDKQIAIIHLNSALEWVVQLFLRNQLSSKIPAESLEELLKQSHGRLLETWVLPLDRSLGLGLEANEWPSIKRIQKLRREAGHPTLLNEIEKLTRADFHKLVKDTVSAVAKLGGLAIPKAPPPMAADVVGGTV